jgi:hypothetical protein
MRIPSRPQFDLRRLSVVAGVAAFLVFVFGHTVTSGLPRQEVCGNAGCETGIYWGGLLPHPAVILMAGVYAVLTIGVVLGVGLLWRAAR